MRMIDRDVEIFRGTGWSACEKRIPSHERNFTAHLPDTDLTSPQAQPVSEGNIENNTGTTPTGRGLRIVGVTQNAESPRRELQTKSPDATSPATSHLMCHESSAAAAHMATASAAPNLHRITQRPRLPAQSPGAHDVQQHHHRLSGCGILRPLKRKPQHSSLDPTAPTLGPNQPLLRVLSSRE